jgi:hypothetical protein
VRRARPAVAVVLAALVVAVVGACADGTPSADLFVVERSGANPGADLVMQVSDGGFVRCNGGPERQFTSEQLIDARAITRELNGDPEDGEPGLVDTTPRLPARPGSQLTYAVRAERGTVRFADNSQPIPKELQELQALVRALAQGPCGLER